MMAGGCFKPYLAPLGGVYRARRTKPCCKERGGIRQFISKDVRHQTCTCARQGRSSIFEMRSGAVPCLEDWATRCGAHGGSTGINSGALPDTGRAISREANSQEAAMQHLWFYHHVTTEEAPYQSKSIYRCSKHEWHDDSLDDVACAWQGTPVMPPDPRRLLGDGKAPQALTLPGLVSWSHSQVGVHGLAREEAGTRDMCIRQHDCEIIQGSHVKLRITDES